jgi:hypothetical protein
MRPIRWLIAVSLVSLTAAGCGGGDSPTSPGPTDGGTTIATGSVSTGGGSVTVHQSGSPLNGLTLNFPAGALDGAMAITIDTSPNVGITRSAAVNPVSPLIGISTSTSTAYAKAPITITVPATIPDNSFPVITVYDKTTGQFEVLTTTSYDAHSVTAVTNHLGAIPQPAVTNDRIAPAGRLRPRLDLTPNPNSTQIFVNAIPRDVLMRDYDAGYRPGVDDWEFPPSTTEASTQGIGFGMELASIWYYVAKPSSKPLNGQFELVPNVPFSDREGFRWSTVIQNQSEERAHDVGTHVASYVNGDDATFDQNCFLSIRAAFAMAPVTPQPQLVVLVNKQGAVFPVIAYKAQGTNLWIENPAKPGDTNQELTFPVGQPMPPVGVLLYGVSTVLESPILMSISSFVPPSTVAASYALAAAGTVGDDIFPTYEMHGRDGVLYDTTYVVDTLRLWFECAKCKNGWSTPVDLPPHGNLLTFGIFELVGTTWTANNTEYPPGGLAFSTSSLTEGQDRVFGGPFFSSAQLNVAYSAGAPMYWLDWHQFTLRRLKLTVTPDSPDEPVNTAITFQVAATPALPPHVTYKWDFGDGTAAVETHDAPSSSHAYKTEGSYTMTVQLVDDRNNQVIGKTTDAVTIGTPKQFWRFTKVTQTSAVMAGIPIPPEGQTAINTTLAEFTTIQTTPSEGSIVVHDDLGAPAVFLQIAAVAGTGTTITDYTDAANHYLLAGSTSVFGSSGSLSITGDPTTGSITGALGLNSITATKDGKTLTGTFVVVISWQASPQNGGGIGSETMTFSFEAKMP